MPLKLNLRELQTETQGLSGELPVSELSLEPLDSALHLTHPLNYELTATLMGEAVLVQG